MPTPPHHLPSSPRVKFLALNGTEPVAETQWSQPITLKTGTRGETEAGHHHGRAPHEVLPPHTPISLPPPAQQPPSGPGAGGKRSAEMIAITSILSILLALLLAGLVATLAFSG